MPVWCCLQLDKAAAAAAAAVGVLEHEAMARLHA